MLMVTATVGQGRVPVVIYRFGGSKAPKLHPTGLEDSALPDEGAPVKMLLAASINADQLTRLIRKRLALPRSAGVELRPCGSEWTLLYGEESMAHLRARVGDPYDSMVHLSYALPGEFDAAPGGDSLSAPTRAAFDNVEIKTKVSAPAHGDSVPSDSKKAAFGATLLEQDRSSWPMTEC
jgi:hypothetical protein